jgi:hypothetical protein
VTDPVGTAENVYRHFGLPLTDAASAAMRSLHATSQHGGRRPAHRYTLADAGLTAEQVDERFSELTAPANPGR